MYFAKLIADQKFHPGLPGIILNPYYFLRRSLCREVADTAGALSGTVIDFGCGSQPYRRYFTAARAYVGMDIEVSGHAHDQLNSLIDVYYDGKNWPFEDGSIDNIFSSETFEHVFNLDENLADMHRVLKPGGLLFATIPFAFPEHEKPYDFARYTEFGMRHLLEKAGFKDIDIRKSGTAVTAISQLWSAYVFQTIGSRHPLLALLSQLLIIAPGTLAAAVLNAILPKNRDLYCSLIIRARKSA